jgi:hypothetical protein
MQSNNAINSGSEKRRSFVAPIFTARVDGNAICICVPLEDEIPSGSLVQR